LRVVKYTHLEAVVLSGLVWCCVELNSASSTGLSPDPLWQSRASPTPMDLGSSDRLATVSEKCIHSVAWPL